MVLLAEFDTGFSVLEGSGYVFEGVTEARGDSHSSDDYTAVCHGEDGGCGFGVCLCCSCSVVYEVKLSKCVMWRQRGELNWFRKGLYVLQWCRHGMAADVDTGAIDTV